jgi:PAS domain S-box-containing protein
VKWLRHVATRTKVLIPAAVLIVAVGTTSLLAVYALQEHEASLRALDDSALDNMALIDKLLSTSAETQSNLEGILLARSAALAAAEVQPLQDRVKLKLDDLGALSGQIRTEWAGDAAGLALIEQMQAPLAAYERQAEEAMLVAADDPVQGTSIGEQAAASYAELHDALLRLEEHQQSEIARIAATANQHVLALNIAIIGISLILTLPGALTALLIGTRGLSRPILALAAAMHRLADGDLQVTIPGTDRGDEIGAMARAVEVFRNDALKNEQLNRALQESEKRLRQITSSLRDVIWLRDARTRELLYINPAYETVWGRTLESVTANPMAGFVDSIHPEDRARVLAAIEKQYQGTPFSEEYRIVRPDGEVRWIRGQSFPIADESGQIYRLVARAEDITERKKADMEITQRNAELVQANEELDAFAHTVAHDLRQPLAVMIAYSEVLQRYSDALTERERAEYLQIVGQHGRKMSNVIREMLLLSSVRKAEVQPAPLDMHRIVEEAQKRLSDMIVEYEAEIKGPDIWPWALGKSPWVEEVWINYISNALKHGGRPPRVELGAAEEENGMVRFWVRDNGPGVAAEDMGSLFAPFTHLRKVRVEGHGLGLSVVRYIVEKLGGRVGYEPSAEPGGGSVFYFTLPAGTALSRGSDASKNSTGGR